MGPFINLLDLLLGTLYLLPVLGSLLAYLIYFRLNRSGGVANILLSSAATGEQSARHDARGRKESFHSSKNLDGLICNRLTVVHRRHFWLIRQRSHRHCRAIVM